MKRRRAIKLSEWAELNSYSYYGALRRFHSGQIDGAFQDPHTRSIFVAVDEPRESSPKNRAVLYSRVSEKKQADRLASQTSRLRDWATSQGYVIVKEVAEIGSGLNDTRPKLTRLMTDTESWDVLIVEYKDRLARFGFNYLHGWAETTNRKIIVVNQAHDGDTESLTDDLMSVITVFCGRLYGKRETKNRVEKITSVLRGE